MAIIITSVIVIATSSVFTVIADIFDETKEIVKKIDSNMKLRCLGGGRILMDELNKFIKVYGYSQGFGKADHEVSVSILKKKYPNFDITWSDES